MATTTATRRQIELPILARPQFAHAVAGASSRRRAAGRPRRTREAAHRHDARRRPAAAGRAADPALPEAVRRRRAFTTPRRCWSTRATCRSRRGSARPTTGTTPIDGQVNGVLAKRSPGSTLKPFVYALALDQGVLHPQTMLRDAPTSFGPFTPENFDGRFFGPISAEEALIRSRNIPAVWVVDAAEAAEPVPVPAERRRARHEAGIVLRPGAGARRRRGHDGGAGRAVRDARQPGACCGRFAPSRRASARRGRAAAQPGGDLRHARHAAAQSASRRRRHDPGARALAGRVEDRHVVGLPRRLVGRRRRVRTCSWSGSATSTARAIRRSSASMPPRRCSSASPTR